MRVLLLTVLAALTTSAAVAQTGGAILSSAGNWELRRSASGPTKEGDRSLPEGFLPIIMMVREELAEAQLEGDAERVKGIELQAQPGRAERL